MTAAALPQTRQTKMIAPPGNAAADTSPEQRYLDALETLLDDALEHHHVEDLVEALTWHLARIGFGYGTKAVADIVRRIGGHVADIAEQHSAGQELEQAKKSGRMTQ